MNESGVKIFRILGFYSHFLATDSFKRNLPGMKSQALKPKKKEPSLGIKLIAHHRMMNGLKVHPELVRTTSLRLRLDESCFGNPL